MDFIKNFIIYKVKQKNIDKLKIFLEKVKNNK